MPRETLIPESVFRDRYIRRYGSCPNFSDPAGKITLGGYMLLGVEIGEFLFSGNIYSPDLGRNSPDEVEFAIPKPRQHGLYQEFAAMRRNPSVRTIFSVSKRSNGSLRTITAYSQGEDEADLYTVTARVGKGRRITRVTYGYYEMPSDLPVLPREGNIVSIDSLRGRRVGMGGQSPQAVR